MTCGHTHHDHAEPSREAVLTALEAADARCVQSNQRLTPARRRVLELLLTSGQPAKAYDLIAAFGENGAAAKPPTVYRALDFLSSQGFVHRIESLNAFVACRTGGEAHAAGFLICTCCGETHEIEPIAAEGVAHAAAAFGYALSRVVVEARGLCGACATQAGP
jgi:Fur family zinc uptake transcriptional regulator